MGGKVAMGGGCDPAGMAIPSSRSALAVPGAVEGPVQRCVHGWLRPTQQPVTASQRSLILRFEEAASPRFGTSNWGGAISENAARGGSSVWRELVARWFSNAATAPSSSRDCLPEW